MPDLRYFSELTTFPRSADADSFIVLLDQSGANPTPVRALGSTIVSGFNSVTTTGVMSGAGSTGDVLDVSGELVAADLVTPSATSAKLSTDIFGVTEFTADSVVSNAFLTLDSSDSAKFNWQPAFDFSASTAETDTSATYTFSTGEIAVKSLVGGTFISITESAGGVDIEGVSPTAPSAVVSDLGSGTSFNIDVSTADVFRINATGAATVTATNFAANLGKAVVVDITHNGNTITVGSGISLGLRTDEPEELNPGTSNFTSTASGLWFVEDAKAAPAGGFDPSDLGTALKFRLRGGFGLDAETGEIRQAITGASDPTLEPGVANGETVIYFDRNISTGLAFQIGTIWNTPSEVHMCFEFDQTYGGGFTTSNVNQYILHFPGNASGSTGFFDAILPTFLGTTSNDLDIRYRIHWSNTIPTQADFTITDVPCRDVTDSRNHFCIWTYDANNSDPYVNGTIRVNPGADTSNFGTPPQPHFALGCGISGTLDTSSNYANLRIAELLVTSPLTTGEREQVEGYMAWKYGLQTNLPIAHPYRFSAP